MLRCTVETPTILSHSLNTFPSRKSRVHASIFTRSTVDAAFHAREFLSFYRFFPLFFPSFFKFFVFTLLVSLFLFLFIFLFFFFYSSTTSLTSFIKSLERCRIYYRASLVGYSKILHAKEVA